MRIPSQNVEIERIYSQILGGVHRSIAICSATSGEGVTSIAMALAQRNLLAGNSTLLVDLDLNHPSLTPLLDIEVLQDNQLLNPPTIINTKTEMTALTGITAPKRRDVIIKLRRPGTLEACIENWLQNFDTVIIDTSPLNKINSHNIPPERVAAACDGTLFVVLASETTEAMISIAIDKLKTSGAVLIGCIINDRINPALKNELLREVSRLGKRFQWLSTRLTKFIKNNRFLSLEV